MWTRPRARVRSSRNASLLERSHFWSRTLQPQNHWAETESRGNQLASCHCPTVCYYETSVQGRAVKTDIRFKPNLLPLTTAAAASFFSFSFPLIHPIQRKQWVGAWCYPGQHWIRYVCTDIYRDFIKSLILAMLSKLIFIDEKLAFSIQLVNI